MRDERTGVVYAPHKDPSRVAASGVVLEKTMPQEWSAPERLINACEAAVRQTNSVVARKIIVAMPRELNDEQQQSLLLEFINAEIRDRGYACVWAIHRDPDNKNPHAHLLIPDQPYGEGKWLPKVRTGYALDANGNKIPVIDKKTGEQKLGKRNRKLWVREQQNHFLGTKEGLKTLREAWAEHANSALEHAGSDERIDHRSYADQGSPLIPTRHEGFVERQRATADSEYFSPVIYENQVIRARNEIILLGQLAREPEIVTPSIVLASDMPTGYTQLIEHTERMLRKGQNWEAAIQTLASYHQESAGNILSITGARLTGNDPIILNEHHNVYSIGYPDVSPLLNLDNDWARSDLQYFFKATAEESLTPKEREYKEGAATQAVESILTGGAPADMPTVSLHTAVRQVIEFILEAVHWLIDLAQLRAADRAQHKNTPSRKKQDWER